MFKTPWDQSSPGQYKPICEPVTNRSVKTTRSFPISAFSGFARFRAQTNFFSQIRTVFGVVGGDHRVVGTQPPTIPVLIRRQVICRF